jgi:hypothetical protein
MPTLREHERGIDALALELVEDREHVGRGHHDQVRLEVDDQPHLPLGHPAGDGNHRAAEPLGAIVRPEPAGEEPVPIGDVNAVAGPSASSPDRACADVGPHVDVAPRVADDGRLAGRATRGVDADDLVRGDGEHAERVVRAQVVLAREGKAREIVETRAVVGMDTRGIERTVVVRHVLVGVPQ